MVTQQSITMKKNRNKIYGHNIFERKKLKINIRQWLWSKKKLKLFNVLLSFMHTNGDEALRDQDNSKNICFAKVILICFNFDEQRKKWNRCKRKRRYRPWKMKLAKQLGWLLDCDAICLLGFHFQTKTQYVLGIISYWPPTLMKNSFEIFLFHLINIRNELLKLFKGIWMIESPAK